MVEKLIQFSVPSFYYGNQTVFKDPVYALYFSKRLNISLAIVKKRRVADKLTPWYIAVNYDLALGFYEGGIYNFATFEDAYNSLVNTFGPVDTIFDYHEFENIARVYSYDRFGDENGYCRWWRFRDEVKEQNRYNEYPEWRNH